MKASPRQQRLLIELQDIDTDLARLKRRAATLPERAALSATDSSHRAARDAFMAAQRVLDSQRADIARVQSDSETVRLRRERDNELIAVSSSPKEVQALQSELETLARRQQELDDRELALMETGEEAQRQFDIAVQALARIDDERAALEAAIATAEREIRDETLQKNIERNGLAAEIQRDILDLYESIRARIGIGAARLRGTVSEASNMALTPAELSGIRAAAEDEIVFCPGTGAILVRNFEDEIEASTQSK